MRPSIVEEQRRRRRDFGVVWEMMLGLEKARLLGRDTDHEETHASKEPHNDARQSPSSPTLLALLYGERFCAPRAYILSGIFTEMRDSVLYIYQTCDVLTPALPMRGYSERYKPLSASQSVTMKIKWVRKRVQTGSNLCLLAFHCFLWRYSARQVLLFWMHIRFP